MENNPKMRIAFFLKNELIPGIDWREITKGNPGCGGSEYMIVLTAHILTMRKNYDITLIAQKKSHFPEGLNIVYTNDLREAIYYCDKENISFLIFKEYPRWIAENCFHNIPKNVNLILWCHNFLPSSSLNFYSTIPNIKSVICVGREQADLYLDHKLFDKIDYIYNGFPIPNHPDKHLLPIDKRENIVTYIGSIMPFKGFHILAKAWPIILKSVPDAQLYIIGSGQVYDDKRTMGKYGIADEDYEKIFMPYLTDKNGNILPSVHFMGRMGNEKSEIVKRTKVGVPNPSGDTETFGIGAVEFQIMGCEVVTRRCCGYLDTVYNKKNLYKKRKAKSLAKNVIKSLKYPSTRFQESYDYIKTNFSIEQTCYSWEKLFEALSNGGNKIHNFKQDIPNKDFQWKWFRIVYGDINKIFKYKLPCMAKWAENRFIRRLVWISHKHF